MAEGGEELTLEELEKLVTSELREGEFSLEGREKQTYLLTLDESLSHLSATGLPLQPELGEIRNLVRALANNPSRHHAEISCSAKDCGLPGYSDLIRLLVDKRGSISTLQEENKKLIATHELDPRQHRSVMDTSSSRHMEDAVQSNAVLVAEAARKSLMEGRTTLEELASVREQALYLRDLHENRHLIDENLSQRMRQVGEKAYGTKLISARQETVDFNTSHSTLKVHVAGYDPRSELFLKYVIEIEARNTKLPRIRGAGDKVSDRFTSTLDFCMGLSPEVVYETLAKEEFVTPVEVSLYTFGPFYSQHSTETPFSSAFQDLLGEGTVLVARSRTHSGPQTEDETAEYLVASPEIEEGLAARMPPTETSRYIYRTRGDRFVKLE